MKTTRILKTAILLLCALLLCGAAALAAEDDLPQLDAPTELKWGVDYKGGHGDDEPLYTVERPGLISWKEGDLTQNMMEITIYRVENGVDKMVSRSTRGFNSDYVRRYRDDDVFYIDDDDSDEEAQNINWDDRNVFLELNTLRNGFPSGSYYFTLRSIGDDVNYRSSEVVKSETWDYVRPTAQLPQVRISGWDWPLAQWEALEDGIDLDGYDIVWYCAADENSPLEIVGENIGTPLPEEEIYSVYQTGLYYFQVRAVSADITQCVNGPWSALSPAYHLTELSGGVNELLRDLSYMGLSNDALREEVWQLDFDALRSSMLADDETLDILNIFEGSMVDDAYKSVEVREVNMNADDISFTGALLNPVTAGEVSLVIAPPEKEDVLPTLYNDAVALRFSMTVEGIADPTDLAVPVAVSLPIPENIDPFFFVLLHYPADGGAPREIRPGAGGYYFEKDGRLYIRTVLDHFSDFIMTELNPSSRAEDYARRAYETILGRAADEEGLEHWVGEMASGVSAGAIIDEFFRSQEYQDQNHSEAETVRLCYQAMLGREPDESEIMNWTAMLADGYSTTRLVAEFVASPEFATICLTYGLTAGSIELGPRDQNGNLTRFVERCYDFALERAADEGGLNEWCGHVLSGDVNEAGELITPERVVFGFVFSGEAQAKERDDAAFITMLYHIMLDRDPDEAGLEAWSTALADWEKNLGQDAGRQKLYAEFAAMPEFGLMLNNFTI